MPLMEWLGATVTFALYAGICAVGWGVVWMIYPETAGLELEGVRELLEDGFGVKKSVERFKAGKKRVRDSAYSDVSVEDEDVDG